MNIITSIRQAIALHTIAAELRRLRARLSELEQHVHAQAVERG